MSDGLLSTATTEYQALKAEIAQRSGAQATLVSAAPAIGGIAITVGAATEHNLILAIAVPLISVSFGLLWLDHAQQIEHLGSHVQKYLEPVLNKISGVDGVMTWEGRDRFKGDGPLGRAFAFNEKLAFPILFVFIAPAALASLQGLALAINTNWSPDSTPAALAVCILLAGALLQALFFTRWVRVIKEIGKNRTRPEGAAATATSPQLPNVCDID